MRYLITIEYLGTNYSGWQNQKNALSIQRVLEDKLSDLLNEKVTLIGSGRTDKGTHAINQKAHFDTESRIDMNRIPLAINTKLPPDIRIKHIANKNNDFHAQHSAKKRIYLYKYYVSRILSPLREGKFAQIVPPIDFTLMKEGANLLVGTHDFKAFSSVGHMQKTTLRTIYNIELNKQNDEIFLEVVGNGFLYKMVRSIAGTLVYLAKGKLSLDDIKQALITGDRKRTGKTYTAHGLYLKDVIY